MNIENLKPVIKLADDLRDCGIECNISLPKIVVIGAQSTGKSSLLESIVGLDFLPRGEGLVTRRPLELRLECLDDKTATPYAYFNDEKTKYTNFEEVKKKIELKTVEIAGSKQNIVDKPIVLTISSPDCPNLSLVDLPGMVKNPISGSDQPDNIEKITTDLTKKYIKDERTIILCVIPANIDLQNSEALKCAREVDPEGKRSLGVLTKVDIMDKGTSAAKILKNPPIKLRHGYIAVKNRSQQDIDEGLPLREALEQEKHYFETNKDYREVSDFVGTSKLSEKLSELLYHQIIRYLPQINEEVTEKIALLEKKLLEIKDAFPVGDIEKITFLNRKITEMSQMLKDIMQGKKTVKAPETGPYQGESNFIMLISKFLAQKDQIFKDAIVDSPVEEVIELIFCIKGISLPGFLPKDIISKRVTDTLNSLNKLTNSFIEEVKNHNSIILENIFGEMNEINKGPKIILKRKALKHLNNISKQTSEFIEELIECEKTMIWTANSGAMLGSVNNIQNEILKGVVDQNHSVQDVELSQIQQSLAKDGPNLDSQTIQKNIASFKVQLIKKAGNELKYQQFKDSNLDMSKHVTEREVLLFYDKLSKYFGILNQNLSDSIPKIVGAKMVLNYRKNLKQYLKQVISEMLQEISEITDEKLVQIKLKETNQQLEGLSDARKKIDIFHLRALDIVKS